MSPIFGKNTVLLLPLNPLQYLNPIIIPHSKFCSKLGSWKKILIIISREQRTNNFLNACDCFELLYRIGATDPQWAHDECLTFGCVPQKMIWIQSWARSQILDEPTMRVSFLTFHRNDSNTIVTTLTLTEKKSLFFLSMTILVICEVRSQIWSQAQSSAETTSVPISIFKFNFKFPLAISW